MHKLSFLKFKKGLKNKKVFVWGLGLNGGGEEAVKFFCRNGSKVFVVDSKSEEELRETVDRLKKFKVEYLFGPHDEKIFQEADLVIKNPAIAWELPLVKKIARKVEIETDVTLFFKFFKGKIFGVTGSKGKTTTTILLANALKATGKKIVLGGNLRVSLFSFIKEKFLEDKKIIAVLELSSFQLEDLALVRRSPNVAIITNILRDHLNRYGTYEKYISAKQNICHFQSREDVKILNAGDKKLNYFEKCGKGRAVYFNGSGRNLNLKTGFFNVDEELFSVEKGKIRRILKISNPILKTEVNLKNACAVAAGLNFFSKLSNCQLENIFNKFKGVPYRMELVRKYKGINFVNDTAATIPDASISAVKSVEGNQILIAGGADKNLKFNQWAGLVSKKVKFLVLFKGTASAKIKKALGKQKKKISFQEVSNMDKAVKLAYKKAVKGDTILLSPGCASFGIFKNEFDRGDQFNQAVKNLR